MFCLLYKSLSVVSACQCILSCQLRNILDCHSHDAKIPIKIKISIINQAFFSIFVYLVCTERITSFQIQFSFYIIKSRMILKLCLFFFRNRILYCFFQILFIIQLLIQRL